MSQPWTVMQRGPARHDTWLTVYRGSPRKARRCYRRQLARMAAGHVLLVDGHGRPVCNRWVPAAGPVPLLPA